MICVCRNCHKHYDENKSRADYKGYCSQKCLHAKAKELGYHKGYGSEYTKLSAHDEIGSVPATNPITHKK